MFERRSAGHRRSIKLNILTTGYASGCSLLLLYTGSRGGLLCLVAAAIILRHYRPAPAASASVEDPASGCAVTY